MQKKQIGGEEGEEEEEEEEEEVMEMFSLAKEKEEV